MIRIDNTSFLGMVKKPAWIEWHEITKVPHCYLSANA